jgi:UDP-3-O-[3-hydroxymyristoyl] glucosamine N-acyltransferase
MNLSELGQKLNLPTFGNGDLNIVGVRDLAFPTPISDEHIYFVASKKVLEKNSSASSIKIVLTTPKLKSEFPNGLVVEEAEAKLYLAKLLQIFDRKPNFGTGISPKASIHPSAKLGKNVTVLDFAVVMEDAEIGDDSVIHPHAVIEPRARIGKNTVIRANSVIGYDCVLGENCLVHSNTTIGADGFGFLDHKGERIKIPQIGNVIIGNHVEIGAGCTIDRAAIESTSIGNYTKLDDQVHVGHNCRFGDYIYIAGCAGFAGGVVMDDYVIVGGQAAIAEHIHVKRGSIIMGLTGVTKDTEEKGMYFGIPARPATEMLRIAAVLDQLPEISRKVKKLNLEK